VRGRLRHFCTRDELTAALAGQGSRIVEVGRRRELWQRQRRLTAPLTLGRPARLVGDVIDRAVREARGASQVPARPSASELARQGYATAFPKPPVVLRGDTDELVHTLLIRLRQRWWYDRQAQHGRSR
jgi:hypothetical protein